MRENKELSCEKNKEMSCAISKMSLMVTGLMRTLKGSAFLNCRSTGFDVNGHDMFSPIAQNVSTFGTQGVSV